METGTPYSGWAIVEQMGHKTIAGFVREVQLAGVPMLRIDVHGPDDADPIATQFIHASTLYALTPTAEAIVRKVAARTRVEPPATWGVQLELPPVDDDEGGDEDEDDEDLLVRMLDEHGLEVVLRLLSDRLADLAMPESDRLTAILAHAISLIETPHAWPEWTAPPAPPASVPTSITAPPDPIVDVDPTCVVDLSDLPF